MWNYRIYKNKEPLFTDSVKRYALRAFLKLPIELDLRRAGGKLFWSLGAHTENALSP